METLEKALALAEKMQHIFVATADASGLPHVAAAGKVAPAPDGRVAVAAWFCPGTVDNLDQNRLISLVIWDATIDTGYQLLGEVEKIEDLAILDGYMPGEEDKPPLPQVERQLIIRVNKIIAFSHAPHSDIGE